MNERSEWPYPALAAALVLAVVLAARQGTGVLIYALDDPYIHLTLARNLAHNGVYGLNPDHFAGAFSSPLWTLLLSASIALLGDRAVYPQAWSLVFAAAGTFATSRLTRLVTPLTLPFAVLTALTAMLVAPMARFLRKHYAGRTVGMNDIGMAA